MNVTVELLLTPAEMVACQHQNRADMTCVVFDVLRATSTMATALHNGAREIIVVGEIDEALRLRASDPNLLLAGERHGKRISAEQTGSVEFNLGNSPREFTPEQVSRRRIALTTTNGTRALQACHGASPILAASFLNLGAVVQTLRHTRTRHVRLISAGTGRHTSFEDVLGAGALLAALPNDQFKPHGDACLIARELYESNKSDLSRAFEQSANGQRLAADPELAPDLWFCTQRDRVPFPVVVVNHSARLARQPRTEPSSATRWR